MPDVTRFVWTILVFLLTCVSDNLHTARGEILVASDENPVQGSKVNLSCTVDLNPDKGFLKFVQDGKLAAYCHLGVCTPNITKIDSRTFILIIPSVPIRASGEWTCSYLNPSKPITIRVIRTASIELTPTTGMPSLEPTTATTELNTEPSSEMNTPTAQPALHVVGDGLFYIFLYNLNRNRKTMKALKLQYILVMGLFAALLLFGCLIWDGILFTQHCSFGRGVFIGCIVAVVLNFSVFAGCYFQIQIQEKCIQPSNTGEAKELEMEELVY